MTDQEYLDACAIAAMQGRLSDYDSLRSLKKSSDIAGITFAEELSLQAYDMAESMLAERNKRMQAEAKPAISTDKLLLLLREAEIGLSLIPNNPSQPLRDEINRVLEVSK